MNSHESNARRQRLLESASAPPGQKWCPQCEAFLDDSNFHENGSRMDGLASLCRNHQNAASRKHYAAAGLTQRHVEKAEQRRNSLKSGLLAIVYLTMDKPCADCGVAPGAERMILRYPVGSVTTRHSPSTMARLGYSEGTIIEWMSRGEPVCLACKRKRPGERGNQIRANEIFDHPRVASAVNGRRSIASEKGGERTREGNILP